MRNSDQGKVITCVKALRQNEAWGTPGNNMRPMSVQYFERNRHSIKSET